MLLYHLTIEENSAVYEHMKNYAANDYAAHRHLSKGPKEALGM